MKRWLVKLCLVVVLLAVHLGPFSLMQMSAAQAAETVVPAYGAPSYVDGSPVGGGVGCTTTYSSADVGPGDYEVGTLAGLKSALAAVSSGHKVFISDNATILVNSLAGKYGNVQGFDCMFYVPAGVTLCAGRR